MLEREPETAASPEPPATAIAPSPAAQLEPPKSTSVDQRDDRWAWVLPSDYGVRADKGGEGGFLAQRYHGAHNGLDLLAPLGTPVLAPCAGSAVVGKNSSHGKWLKLVCPLPRRLAPDPGLRASLFFAHLATTEWNDGDPRSVERGDKVGGVGKTGNASGSDIAPHLHFEIALHENEAAAIAETHSGRDQSDNRGAHAVLGRMASDCLEPNGLSRKSGDVARGRRVDPFVLLSCAVADKPAYKRPLGKLAESSVPWSQLYHAERFDIDRGLTPAQ